MKMITRLVGGTSMRSLVAHHLHGTTTAAALGRTRTVPVVVARNKMMIVPSTTVTSATASFSTSSVTSQQQQQQQPIRWGILSAGRIAADYCEAIRMTDNAVAVAVAARDDGTRAAAFAADHGVRKSYGSYEELLSDDEVDVVYVGTVANQHDSVARMCLQAGKPVVVEKPLTPSYRQTAELVKFAQEQNAFLMEGMWTRCFPAMKRVRELLHSSNGSGSGSDCDSSIIGRPVAVQGDFGWSTVHCNDDDRIWDPVSGGMTLDIGMYLAQLGTVVFGEHSRVDTIQAAGTVRNGVDHTVVANCMFRFPTNDDNNGNLDTTTTATSSSLSLSSSSSSSSEAVGVLQFYITGEANTQERVCIQGTSGRIIIEGPAHVPQRIRIETDKGRGGMNEVKVMDFPLPDDSHVTWNYPGSVGFTYQIQAVGNAVRAGLTECPDYTWKDSLQVAAILDVIRAQVYKSQTTSDNNVDKAGSDRQGQDDLVAAAQ